jgi:hypothetical protein
METQAEVEGISTNFKKIILTLYIYKTVRNKPNMMMMMEKPSNTTKSIYYSLLNEQELKKFLQFLFIA